MMNNIVYCAYFVKAEGVSWTFSNLNKAMDFVRTMLTADGYIKIEIEKHEVKGGEE